MGIPMLETVVLDIEGERVLLPAGLRDLSGPSERYYPVLVLKHGGGLTEGETPSLIPAALQELEAMKTDLDDRLDGYWAPRTIATHLTSSLKRYWPLYACTGALFTLAGLGADALFSSEIEQYTFPFMAVSLGITGLLAAAAAVLTGYASTGQRLQDSRSLGEDSYGALESGAARILLERDPTVADMERALSGGKGLYELDVRCIAQDESLCIALANLYQRTSGENMMLPDHAAESVSRMYHEVDEDLKDLGLPSLDKSTVWR